MMAEHSHGSRTGLALVWSAVIACPCHWPLVLIALLGGTAIGATLRANFVLVFAASAAYFALALGLGLWLIRRARKCPTCAAGPSDGDTAELLSSGRDRSRQAVPS